MTKQTHTFYHSTDADWWRQAVVYQIYPRSFADGNADGIGDLAGAISRIPYLKALGVDAVWLSPFYPSPLVDGGYDVADYRAIDPRIGTLEQFDSLVGAAHAAGMRIIIDIVPNHTSSKHAWFQEALASPKGSSARSKYHFVDGIGPDGSQPPSDWHSLFGGSAWEPVGDGQFYLHLFAREQPDLNWDNPEVRREFLNIFRFWSDRGVDGYRIDVAHGLSKDLKHPLPSEAQLDELAAKGHRVLWDRDEVQEIYHEWRQLFNEYDPPRIAVAEAWVDAERRPRYASRDSLGQAFNFDLLAAHFDAATYKKTIDHNIKLAAASGSSCTWVLSNHDVVRHATRYGLENAGDNASGEGVPWVVAGAHKSILDRELGLRRARSASLLMMALPGSSYLYQGEELGLHEVSEIPDSQRQDPAFLRNPGAGPGRDGCRVPLPWLSTGSSYGFGQGGAHLPQPAWFADVSVEQQESDPSSTLSLYRRALALRRQLQADEMFSWHTRPEPDVLEFERPGGWVVVANFGENHVPLPPGRVLVSSQPLEDAMLPPATTAWIKAVE